jgi:hypothetical protein
MQIVTIQSSNSYSKENGNSIVLFMETVGIIGNMAGLPESGWVYVIL